jgi:nucleoside-diphosphate-sugar epimerase
MATITVKASRIEEMRFYDQWTALKAELEANGHEVRGIGHLGEFSKLPLPPELPDPFTIVIALAVAKHLAREAVDALVEEVRAAVVSHLRGRFGKNTRTVQIVDEHDNVLLEVEVQDESAQT